MSQTKMEKLLKIRQLMEDAAIVGACRVAIQNRAYVQSEEGDPDMTRKERREHEEARAETDEWVRKNQQEVIARLAPMAKQGEPYIDTGQTRFEAWNLNGFQGLFTSPELALRVAQERVGRGTREFWAVDHKTGRVFRSSDFPPIPRPFSSFQSQ